VPRLSSNTLLEDHDRRRWGGLAAASLACTTVSQQLTLVNCAFLLVLDLSGPRNAAGAGNSSGTQWTPGISAHHPGGAVVLGGHACTAGGPYKCLAAITLAALWLRLQSPSVTSDRCKMRFKGLCVCLRLSSSLSPVMEWLNC